MPFFGKQFRRRATAGFSPENKEEPRLTPDLEENLQNLVQSLGFTEELQVTTLKRKKPAQALAYLKSMVDVNLLQYSLNFLGEDKELLAEESADSFSPIIAMLHQGYAVLFTQGQSKCRLLYAPLRKHREPKQPFHQKSINGPKDGFVEDGGVNLYLLRAKLRDEKLRIRKMTVGRRSKSAVYVLYIEDLAQPEIVDTVLKRLAAIDTDTILDSIELSQYLEESWASPFPQLEITERPDVAVSSLCQGRVAILHETSPGLLLAPTTFFDLLDVPDDYYNTWSVSSSIIRFVRLTAVLLAILLPSLYIALTAYNNDFIPTELALLVAVSREGVPFPIPLEAFMVVSVIEFAREAMNILPSFPHAAIIGVIAVALCLLAVSANYFSSIMVAVIFLGLICSSVIPDKDLRISIRELQFFFMLMASFLGIFGVAMAFFYITIHAVNLKSFGIPYLSPAAPINPSDWRRNLFRFPIFALPRQKTFHPQDEKRQEATVDRKEGVYLEKKPR